MQLKGATASGDAAGAVGTATTTAFVHLHDLSTHHPLLLLVRLLDGHGLRVRLKLRLLLLLLYRLLLSEELALRPHDLLLRQLGLALRVLLHGQLHLLL